MCSYQDKAVTLQLIEFAHSNQSLKKVQSSCPGHVNFPSGQVTFYSSLFSKSSAN